MPIEIIKPRQRKEEVSYELVCERERGCGFSFTCDKDGNVDLEELAPLGRDNYKKVLQDPEYKKEVVPFVHRWTEPAIGKCHCGALVMLEGFTNTCEGCGRDYNSAGQMLADRSQWEYETGEHPADILRIR